jgi:hypothetical protein
MQIKAALKFQVMSTRMARIKDNNNNKFWQGCGETGTFIHCWWECKLIKPLWKIVDRRTSHITAI